MDNFNNNHPEKEKGEVFLINASKKEVAKGFLSDISEKCEYVRLGKVAYSPSGQEVDSKFKPVFCKLKN